MNYITLTYQVSTDLVDEPANEQLFTLTLLEKLKKVYDKILEQLTPYDIRLLRDEGTNKKNKLALELLQRESATHRVSCGKCSNKEENQTKQFQT